MKNNFSAWLEIDRRKIRSNLNAIRSITKKTPLMAMVKCNAYGLGINEIGPVLIKENISYFGVFNLSEAIKLRQFSRSITIAYFSPFAYVDRQTISDNNVIPVLMTCEDAIKFITETDKYPQQKKVFLKVNTGLNRWGMSDEEILNIAPIFRRENIEIIGLCTTLKENKQDNNQVRSLQILKANLQKKNIKIPFLSFASSDFLLTNDTDEKSLIRIGILLYGLYPDKKTQKKEKISVSPIFSLKSRISQIRILFKGETVLYKGCYKATKKITIAIVPIGYSHGYPHNLAGKSYVLVQGIRCAVLGISMSVLIIDISDIPSAIVGDEVVLMGEQKGAVISPVKIADLAGISCYVLLTRLNNDIKRIIN